MLPEYDVRGKKGVRGKYYRAYRQGHTVKVYKADGTVSIRYFTLADGAVMLEPDVRQYFPNADTVNAALRSLIALIPAKSARRKTVTKSRRLQQAHVGACNHGARANPGMNPPRSRVCPPRRVRPATAPTNPFPRIHVAETLDDAVGSVGI
ncbi:MAG: hypothetical protein M5R38_03455 [Candidatus Methylomirabilis sp.]|nr:hypothetical protein [Candidatus Methylomirabilis sp.]